MGSMLCCWWIFNDCLTCTATCHTVVMMPDLIVHRPQVQGPNLLCAGAQGACTRVGFCFAVLLADGLHRPPYDDLHANSLYLCGGHNSVPSRSVVICYSGSFARHSADDLHTELESICTLKRYYERRPVEGDLHCRRQSYRRARICTTGTRWMRRMRW